MVKLDLSKRGLTEIQFIPEDITELDLECNKIVGIKENEFPIGLQVLNLSYNQIVELKENVFPPNLITLYLNNNKIVELKENVFLPNLLTLGLTGNQIVQLKENVFPSNLKVLHLSNNNITEIKENVFPQKLITLYLNNNQIVELKEDIFPSNLQTLHLYDNKIKKLKGNIFPLNLQRLYLQNNKIFQLKENIFPPNLKTLYLHNNQIIELIKNVFPFNLQILYLADNRITELNKNIFPPNLITLDLSGNQIKELPLHLLNMRRLDVNGFNYFNNPIEFISLPVQRWLDRINQGITQNNQVYSDTQNIHNSNIQKSFRSSLENIMKDKLYYSLDKCKEQLLLSSLSEEVKREVLNYCDDKTTHSIYLITFEDLFHYVMNRILNHQDKDEIFKVLDEEIKDTICKCFTGRMTRLLNVLNGFYPDIKIQIGSNEQITNIILMLKEKYEDVNVLKKKVKEELEERGYEKDVIEEWISFIE